MFGYTIGGQACDMVFTSVLGHLQQLDFTSSHTKWYSCNPSELYTAPVIKSVAEVGRSKKRVVVLPRAAQLIVCEGVSQLARRQPAALPCSRSKRCLKVPATWQPSHSAFLEHLSVEYGLYPDTLVCPLPQRTRSSCRKVLSSRHGSVPG